MRGFRDPVDSHCFRYVKKGTLLLMTRTDEPAQLVELEEWYVGSEDEIKVKRVSNGEIIVEYLRGLSFPTLEEVDRLMPSLADRVRMGVAQNLTAQRAAESAPPETRDTKYGPLD